MKGKILEKKKERLDIKRQGIWIWDELANAVSHGIGVLLAIAAIPILVIMAEDAVSVVTGAVFGASLVVLYLASTLYHAVPEGKLKRFLQRSDHAAIYLLIAGSYTPFTLGILRGAWGWTLFGIVWGLAVFGVFFKLVVGTRFNAVSTVIYIVMGWLVIIAVKPLLQNMEPAGFVLLLAGGLSYTVGVIFYLMHDRPFMHFIWHLFVLGGSICHFFAVLWYSV